LLTTSIVDRYMRPNMRRLRSAPVALIAVLASAGVVGAVSLPDAASQGLSTATEHAGHAVPVVPAAVPVVDVETEADAPETETDAPETEVPDAAAHGATVSAVARAEDTTSDTNHGADVSAVAKANHGQTTAATHKPANAGRPAGAGKPAVAGKPANPGRP
jgi:hypothetical protein